MTAHCRAKLNSEPPQDCDAPYCGCKAEWSECIDLLMEFGWLSPAAAQAIVKAKDRALIERDLALRQLERARYSAEEWSKSCDYWRERVDEYEKLNRAV